ncbi:amphi-Trp domain-containing protein [Halobellus sp. Atlit-38R]|jgi:amphi-Trp domain-containing protein|uniref:amphi-Trp domain-containing protein n=1 Tax=Halobellus sp. Atlit-38R TaxID=2282131 RepID=UPI000EF1B1E3|nr:amphi-Trp domain-containing protein [Halobellus sp. Atlit-38R]RLM94809.1 amphi-Trp domain-containing protein [Halobellus sp. Atlit-38R]
MSEIETESEKTRAEVAAYLRDLADQLEGGGEFALELGGRQMQVDPTDSVTFKLEGESDPVESGTESKESIEFELVWWREAHSDDVEAQQQQETGDSAGSE